MKLIPTSAFAECEVPADVDVEKLLFTALFSAKEKELTSLARRLRIELFTLEPFKLALPILLKRINAGLGADWNLLCREAVEDETFSMFCSIEKLHGCLVSADPNKLQNYLAVLEEKAAARAIQAASFDLWRDVSQGSSPEASYKTFANLARKALAGSQRELATSDDAFVALEDKMEKILNNTHPPIHFGIKTIDGATNGIMPGEMCVVAAATSVGKTAFLNSVTRYNARSIKEAGGQIYYATPEMDKAEQAARLISLEATVHTGVWRSGRINAAERQRIELAKTLFRDLVIFNDKKKLTIRDIELDIATLTAQGRKPMLIVVDFLQRLALAHGGDDQRIANATIAYDLVDLAKETGIPVLCGAQVGDKPNARNPMRPMPVISDIMESRAIDQAADLCMTLYRHGHFFPSQACECEATINLAKNRGGRVAIYPAGFNGDYGLFTNEIYDCNCAFCESKKAERMTK